MRRIENSIPDRLLVLVLLVVIVVGCSQSPAAAPADRGVSAPRSEIAATRSVELRLIGLEPTAMGSAVQAVRVVTVTEFVGAFPHRDRTGTVFVLDAGKFVGPVGGNTEGGDGRELSEATKLVTVGTAYALAPPLMPSDVGTSGLAFVMEWDLPGVRGLPVMQSSGVVQSADRVAAALRETGEIATLVEIVDFYPKPPSATEETRGRVSNESLSWKSLLSKVETARLDTFAGSATNE